MDKKCKVCDGTGVQWGSLGAGCGSGGESVRIDCYNCKGTGKEPIYEKDMCSMCKKEKATVIADGFEMCISCASAYR